MVVDSERWYSLQPPCIAAIAQARWMKADGGNAKPKTKEAKALKTWMNQDKRLSTYLGFGQNICKRCMNFICFLMQLVFITEQWALHLISCHESKSRRKNDVPRANGYQWSTLLYAAFECQRLEWSSKMVMYWVERHSAILQLECHKEVAYSTVCKARSSSNVLLFPRVNLILVRAICDI